MRPATKKHDRAFRALGETGAARRSRPGGPGVSPGKGSGARFVCHDCGRGALPSPALPHDPDSNDWAPEEPEVVRDDVYSGSLAEGSYAGGAPLQVTVAATEDSTRASPSTLAGSMACTGSSITTKPNGESAAVARQEQRHDVLSRPRPF